MLVSIDGGAAVSVATDPTTGLWTYSPVVADGAHTVNVTGSTDLAGNVGQASLAFTVDRIAPAVTEALGRRQRRVGDRQGHQQRHDRRIR